MVVTGNEVQCTIESPCTAVQLLAQKINAIEQDINRLESRLPPWVMGAAWLCGVVIGVLATLVSVYYQAPALGGVL